MSWPCKLRQLWHVTRVEYARLFQRSLCNRLPKTTRTLYIKLTWTCYVTVAQKYPVCFKKKTWRRFWRQQPQRTFNTWRLATNSERQNSKRGHIGLQHVAHAKLVEIPVWTLVKEHLGSLALGKHIPGLVLCPELPLQTSTKPQYWEFEWIRDLMWNILGTCRGWLIMWNELSLMVFGDCRLLCSMDNTFGTGALASPALPGSPSALWDRSCLASGDCRSQMIAADFLMNFLAEPPRCILLLLCRSPTQSDLHLRIER